MKNQTGIIGLVAIYVIEAITIGLCRTLSANSSEVLLDFVVPAIMIAFAGPLVIIVNNWENCSDWPRGFFVIRRMIDILLVAEILPMDLLVNEFAKVLILVGVSSLCFVQVVRASRIKDTSRFSALSLLLRKTFTYLKFFHGC